MAEFYKKNFSKRSFYYFHYSLKTLQVHACEYLSLKTTCRVLIHSIRVNIFENLTFLSKLM